MISKILLLGKIYPQNLTSFILGSMVRWEIPLIGPLLNRLFVVVFGINMNEAEFSIDKYRTIEDVFTRKLKDGERPIAGDLVSPSDGTWSQGGPTHGGAAIQAKGLIYSASELVFGSAKPTEKKLVHFHTVYLAPHNYHRVHTPVSGQLRRIRYIPGELWPVNQPFVRWLPNLFVRNERMVFEIELSQGGWVYAVMVGALNVGRISTPFLPDFFSNDYLKGRRSNIFEMDHEISLNAGDELGTFMLGSTVVLVFDEDAAKKFEMVELTGKKTVKMGEKLIP